MPLWAATIVALFLLMFAVPVASMIAVLWARIIYLTFIDLRDMDIERLFGDVFAILFGGVFGGMIGYGAFAMGAFVIDGLIGRYVEYFSW